jgi:hypothetical protein
MKNHLSIKAVIVVICSLIIAGNNQVYCQSYTDIGNIRLSISGFGTIGNIFSGLPSVPSCEYPRGSGIEHIALGGLWVGGIKNFNGNRVRTVTTAAIEGTVQLGQGFEFTNPKGQELTQRSSDVLNLYYTPSAISQLDFVSNFTDTNLTVPSSGERIPKHDYPLGLAVHFESYSWSYSFADFFVLLSYTIKNVSSTPIDSVYIGLWTEMAVGNTRLGKNRAGSTGFYSEGGNGLIDSLRMMYEWDAGLDNGYADSYVAARLLGSTPELGTTYYNAWVYRNANGDEWQQSPVDDEQKYRRLSSTFLNQVTIAEASALLQKPGSRTSLISTGPYIRLEAGDSVTVNFGIICAKRTGLQTADNEQTRRTLLANANWAQRAYNGTDQNGNNKLDSNEVDLNGDGKIVRYILPSPPPIPRSRIVLEEGKATVYWSDNAETSVDLLTKRKNFEGYNLYRSNVGDDLRDNPALHLAATFDKPDDKIGYDNGFESIRILDSDKKPIRKYFAGDTVGYTYKYVFDNILSGWQYSSAVTAFSDGDALSGLPSLESSILASEKRFIPGTSADTTENSEVGIYPNPYYTSAGWDGKVNVERGRKLYFYNLPAHARITIFSLAGDKIHSFMHEAGISEGANIQWFEQTGTTKTTKPQFSGGQHAWDLLTDYEQPIASGLYIVHVEDIDTGKTKTGNFLILK